MIKRFLKKIESDKFYSEFHSLIHDKHHALNGANFNSVVFYLAILASGSNLFISIFLMLLLCRAVTLNIGIFMSFAKHTFG